MAAVTPSGRGSRDAGNEPTALAYLVGARLPPRAEQDWARKPRPEYVTFVDRNHSTLLDYGFAEQCGQGAARAFQRRGMPHVALAATAASMHRNYDVFLVSGEDVGLPLSLFARLRGISTPIYMITHGSYFRSPRFRWLMRLVRRFQDVHFLCLAESLRSTLCRRFNVSAAMAHNTGYGVDTLYFRPGPPPERPLIVSAGTATRDYRSLVKAAEGLPVDVKIAADSAWFPTSVDIAGDALPPNIEARSYENYQGLRGLYSAASFVVVPLYASQHACGFAVTIEAMAMGKPVISTRTDAHSDFIVEGETGLYVPPGDVDALRGAIQQLLADPDRTRQMGIQARQMIEERYSLEAYCKRIENVLADATEAPPGAIR